MFSKMCIFGLILCSVVIGLPAPSKKLTKLNLDPDFIKALAAYNRLEPKRSKDELRTITTIGIMNGALEAQKNMEKELTNSVAELVLNSNMMDKKLAMPKIEKVEKMIERDRQAINVLGSALDLARKSITTQEYRNQMKNAMKTFNQKQKETNLKNVDMTNRLENLKINVLEHMNVMHQTIVDKTNATIEYLETKQGLKPIKDKVKRDNNQVSITTPTPSITTTTENILKAILGNNYEENLIEINRRLDDNKNVQTFTSEKELIDKDNKINNSSRENSDDDIKQFGKQEENFGESEGGGDQPAAGGGGLVGLIASLSGGEGGSDVGALIGSLTGVISNLFGPGGLDVESLISTGTSLIAGLLGGNQNFGIVLGNYVGTAFDGLSGGGGAINNGKFVGNFLGTVLAALSADPEDEDLPPKPQIFIQNFLNSFLKAKSKTGGGETDDGETPMSPSEGSDSFGFIKHIVSAIVGGVTSFVLNASLGSSGGLSDGSAGLFSSSSSTNKHPPTW